MISAIRDQKSQKKTGKPQREREEMKNTKAKLAVAVCCLGSLAAVNDGRAGLSDLDISVYYDYRMDVVANGTTHNTYATAFSANLVGGAALPSPHTDPFVTFCLDISANLGNGWWTSGSFADTALTGNGGNRISDGLYRAASLYAYYSPGIMSVVGNGSGYSWTDKEKGAALQLAIWEVLYDGSGANDISLYDVTIGGANGFQVASAYQINNSANAAVVSLANTMLHNSSANYVNSSLDATFWNAVDANGNPRSSQDLIGPMSGTSKAVPEPTTILAGALLLLPFGVSTARILRKKRAA
jgi:hypothetical protein